MQKTIDRLHDLYASFEGLVASDKQGDSFTDFSKVGDLIRAQFAFSPNSNGDSERKLIRYTMGRVKAKTVSPNKLDQVVDVGYDCTEQQLQTFYRYLKYASATNFDTPTHQAPFVEVPTIELLSKALQVFERDYMRNWQAPDIFVAIPENANVLRILSSTKLDRRQIKTHSILTDRVLRVVLKNLQILGWIEEEKVEEQRGLYWIWLTPLGHRLRDAGSRTEAAVESLWEGRLGTTSFADLKQTLAHMVDTQELEYPDHLTGYGPVDPALTGGNYLPAESGPPYVPPRGVEWPVVPRNLARTGDSMSLPALLSKVILQFDVDYAKLNVGSLYLTAVLLAKVGDEGMPLHKAQELVTGVAKVAGNGKSLMERHMHVVVDEGRPSNRDRILHPTPKARYMRDVYPIALANVEAQWRTTYGADRITKLRDALANIVTNQGERLEVFPDPCQWIWELNQKRWLAEKSS